MKVPLYARTLFAILLTGLLFAGGAQATLNSHGKGMIYESEQNITWLANAGQAGGNLSWSEANDWATGLNYAGVSGWRLPTAVPTDDYYSTASEMGHLFYGDGDSGLGGTADTPITDVHNANFDLFSNLVAGGYWTGTPYAAVELYAWNFDFYDGTQLPYDQSVQMGAWAVHAGDVSAVPEPSSIVLIGLGGAALLVLRRRTT